VTPAATRNDAIDAFRGLSILAVIAYHYLVRWAPPFHSENLYGFEAVYPPVLELGRYGVHVFFVISGLVIAMTVSRCADAGEFFVRRFARLYPAYLAAALITFPLVLWLGPQESRVEVADLLATFTMFAPLFGREHVDGAYWSLMVEVTFYGWVALSFLLLKSRFWIGVIAVGVLGAGASFVHAKAADLVFVARHMPLFLLGMALWYGAFARQRRTALALAGAGALLYAAQFGRIADGWGGHLFIAIGAAALAASCVGRFERWGALAWIGRRSYSLYLVHQLIGLGVIYRLKAMGAPDLLAVAAAIAVSFALAPAMYRWVELPGQTVVMGAYRRLRRLDPPAAPAESVKEAA